MIINTVEGIDLQATLAATCLANTLDRQCPHHPLNCRGGQLAYHEDGTFACEHAQVEPDDQRTRDALNYTVAILLMECAASL